MATPPSRPRPARLGRRPGEIRPPLEDAPGEDQEGCEQNTIDDAVPEQGGAHCDGGRGDAPWEVRSNP